MNLLFDEKKIKKFWSKIDIKDNKEECWEWQEKSRSKDGYGQLQIDNVRIYAHKLAFWLTFNVDSRDKEVCHKCDNPPCCNPYHLFQGTHLDNMQDCSNKKRFPDRRGSLNGRARLSEEEVLHIRSLIKSGVKSKIIRKIYSITRFHMWNIKTKRIWKHI